MGKSCFCPSAEKENREMLTGDWKVSELESVRIHFLPILSKIGKCQNWKVSESETVRISDWEPRIGRI